MLPPRVGDPTLSVTYFNYTSTTNEVSKIHQFLRSWRPYGGCDGLHDVIHEEPRESRQRSSDNVPSGKLA